MRGRSAALALSLLAALAVPHAVAQDEDRLRRVEEEIDGARRQQGEVAAAVEGVLGEIETIDREAVEAREDLEAAAEELGRAVEDRRRAEGRIAALDREHEALQVRVAERAVGLHRLAHRGLAPLLFEGEPDRESAARHRRYLHAILERDRELLEAVRRNRSEAALAREEAVEAETAAKRARRRHERALATLEERRREKDRRLARLRDEADDKAVLVRELEAAAAKLRQLLRRRPQTLEAPLTAGQWAAPLARLGRVVAVRNGIEVDAPRGTAVLAARDGRVVFSDWFPGYGRLVVLDHGGHWHTVYGYVEEVLVAPGQAVSAGEEIARVGDTGSARRPSLYFELRRRGEPRDAAAALRIKRVEKAGSAL